MEQMQKNICKIKIDGNQGTGFFCKIPFPNKDNMLPVLITNNHIIKQDILYKNDEIIKIKIKNDEKEKKINLNDRKKYTNEKFDITIIELKPKDEINDFMELDDAIINDILNNKNENADYIDRTVYIIQYPEGMLSVSYGMFNKFMKINRMILLIFVVQRVVHRVHLSLILIIKLLVYIRKELIKNLIKVLF